MQPDFPRGPLVLAGPGTVTAIDGLTFVISDQVGDISAGPQGLIAYDVRHVSLLALTVNGAPLTHLGTGMPAANTVRFRGYPALADEGPDVVVEAARRRGVRERGMDEEIVFRSWCHTAVSLSVNLDVDCDFADIFEIRRVPVAVSDSRVCLAASAERGEMRFGDSSLATRVRMDPPPDKQNRGRATWDVVVPARSTWTLRLSVDVQTSAAPRMVRPPGATAGDAPPHAPAVASDPPGLMRAVGSSLVDLDALTLVDDMDASRRLVAAGIPWFVALFGRDSLITSHQARAFSPQLSVATLRALAARQGCVSDMGNGEQPGKILHEVRLTNRPWLGEGTASGAHPYFGSIDATPLFLMMLGSAWRWGLSRSIVEELLPAATAALSWMRGPGDPDGDGLLEYRAVGPRALANQAWKDSENAVQFADGRLAEAPIAMVEVQAYAYAARRALAEIFGWLGYDSAAVDLTDEADALRELIRSRYWIDPGGGRPGYFALALDAEKQPVDSVASNMGHLLWCGVPSASEAADVARHLTSPDLASGWGLRTLARSMTGFNPISYHLGSVWPHDTAIACEGLRLYGHDDEALSLVSDLMRALASFDDRLPELFGGHQSETGDFPVPYPTACRPQAWAAGVPLSLVPLMLGLAPRFHDNVISVAPALPHGVRRLDVRGIPFPTGRLSVVADEEGTGIVEAPPGVTVEIRSGR